MRGIGREWRERQRQQGCKRHHRTSIVRESRCTIESSLDYAWRKKHNGVIKQAAPMPKAYSLVGCRRF
jgi:hypothetical protein